MTSWARLFGRQGYANHEDGTFALLTLSGDRPAMHIHDPFGDRYGWPSFVSLPTSIATKFWRGIKRSEREGGRDAGFVHEVVEAMVSPTSSGPDQLPAGKSKRFAPDTACCSPKRRATLKSTDYPEACYIVSATGVNLSRGFGERLTLATRQDLSTLTCFEELRRERGSNANRQGLRRGASWPKFRLLLARPHRTAILARSAFALAVP